MSQELTQKRTTVSGKLPTLTVKVPWPRLALDAPTATAATLLLRLINYWSIVALGFVLYVSTRKNNDAIPGRVVMTRRSRKERRTGWYL